MGIVEFSVKQDIVFGVGSISALPEKVKKLGGTKVLLVSDPGLIDVGITAKIEDILKTENIPYALFTHIEPDPGQWIVEECIEMLVNEKCDLVVALGGGSAMDVAKSAAIVGYSGKKINDFWGYYLPVDNDTVPCIAIATTAGTGSEVTRNTVITDSSKTYKMVILNDKILPDVAIEDPNLITSLPPSIAAATGLDALVHAVETYLASNANAFTESVAEKAMELIGGALPRFVARRDDIEAATNMMMGSTLAGITLSLAIVNQAHALSHPLTGFYHIPHGLANAMLFPTTMKYNALADHGKYKKIYNLLRTGEGHGYVNEFEPEMLIDYLLKLNDRLGLPKNLSAMGVTEEHLDAMVEDAQKTKIYDFVPRTTNAKEIRELYLEAMYR